MKDKIAMMVIGAQKAGTTSLNNYLSQHPQIYTHFTLEFSLFNRDHYEKGFDYYFDTTISDKRKNDPSCCFVAKSVGLMYKPELLKKLREENPNIQLIIVLRNPVERAYSAFLFCEKEGIEPYKEFEDAIFVNDISRFNGDKAFELACDYIGRSSYLQHIKNVLEIFPAQNVHFFLFEKMIKELNQSLNEMTSLIDLPAYAFDTSIQYNEGKLTRSKSVAKLLSPGKKNFVKSWLPAKQRTKIKQFLKKLNSKQKAGEKSMMKTETREYLQHLFKNDLPELEQLTKLPVRTYWNEFEK